MSESKRSPFAHLVLFMMCLAITGSVLAGAHYYAVDLPAQNNLQAPENALYSETNCALCLHNCKVDPDRYLCESICRDLECSGKT
jgi:hypothetical protein